MSGIQLDTSDAAELAEMLTFIRDWLAGPDGAQFATSLQRFMGVDAYDLTDLCTNLARFSLLLGYDDGERLFGGDEQ
jgi:hypothetical protein